MLKKSIIEELNLQINRELTSSYIYLAMSAYCKANNMDGFAGWLKVQSEEENEHAMKIYDYLNDLGIAVELESIKKPKSNYKNYIELFTAVVDQEIAITKNIEDLANLALKEKDNLTYNFLGWFLEEQVEEIALVTSILDKLKLIGENNNGLYMLDQELGKRGGDKKGSCGCDC